MKQKSDKIKKLIITLNILLSYSIHMNAQETGQGIVGAWQYDDATYVVKTNNKACTEAIIERLNEIIIDYYDGFILENLADGSYKVGGSTSGRYEIDGDTYINYHEGTTQTMLFEVTGDILTFRLDPVQLGLLRPNALKKLGINPDDLEIHEAEILTYWKRIIGGIVFEDDDDELYDSDFDIDVVFDNGIILLNSVERVENIVGKWQFIKTKTEVKASDQEVVKEICDEFNAFNDHIYLSYMQFSPDGEFKEYLLDTDIIEDTYEVNGSNLDIQNKVSCQFIIKNGYLDLKFDYTQRFMHVYTNDKPNSNSLKKVVQHIYMKRVPDDFDIQAAMRASLIRDSIIVVSKCPGKEKEEIVGVWKVLKTKPVVLSNSNEYSKYLGTLLQSMLTGVFDHNITFDGKLMCNEYDCMPYTIDGDVLTNGNNKMHIAINDNILTMEYDLREVLLTWGVSIDIDEGMVRIIKFAARAYYERMP